MSEISKEKILFRRQYIYGKDLVNDLGWKRVEARNDHFFLVHPDLEVTQVNRGRNQFFLLGYILDPENPAYNNSRVLENLAGCSRNVNQVADFLEDKSGRYALFCFLGESKFVINDATGLRQVFYYEGGDGSLCVASLSGMIAGRFGLQVSEEAKGYINSERYQEKKEPWWPGNSTPYENIFHLLPNHYLDLRNGKVVRFWPNKRIRRYSLRSGRKLTADLLKKILTSLHARYPLAISLSSGHDSRVLLAACRDFYREISTFSMMYRSISDEKDDIRVPRQLTSRLGIAHRVIVCNTSPDEEFVNAYNESTRDYKTDWLPIVHARRHELPADTLILKGSVAEVGSCSYWAYGVYPFRVTLRALIGKVNLGRGPFVVRHLKNWMIEALPSEKFGYKLYDLFAWENEAGNWQGMSHSIFDLAQEEYSPFSNRKLLSIMLGVNPKYRSLPDKILETDIIKHFWQELLDFPFNPDWEHQKRRVYDGGLVNLLRWVKYFFSKEKYGKFE